MVELLVAAAAGPCAAPRRGLGPAAEPCGQPGETGGLEEDDQDDREAVEEARRLARGEAALAGAADERQRVGVPLEDQRHAR